MERRTWIKHASKIALASGAVLLSGTAFGQPGRHGGDRRGHGPGGMRFMRDLDLTEEQRNQLRTLREQNREQMEAARTRLSDAKKRLNDAVEQGADEFAIRSLADEVGAAEGEAAVMRSQQMAQFKGLLTDEQLQKMEQLKAEREERHKERQQRFQERRSRRRERNPERF